MIITACAIVYTVLLIAVAASMLVYMVSTGDAAN